MDEYISKHEAYTMLKDLEAAYIYPPVKEAYRTAARRIDQMLSADVQPVNQWISVKDRLPNEDDCYLVVIESEICVSIDIAEYSENRWHKHDKVLYWQPLPEPPKDGDTNG